MADKEQRYVESSLQFYKHAVSKKVKLLQVCLTCKEESTLTWVFTKLEFCAFLMSQALSALLVNP